MSEGAAPIRRGLLGSIRARLVAWFLLIALVPLGLILFIITTSVSEAVEALALDRVSSLTRERTRQLEHYADERLRSLDAVARAPAFAACCRRLEAALEGEPAARDAAVAATLDDYGPFLESFADEHGYHDLLLIGPEGRILLSLSRAPLVGERLDSPAWKGGSLARTVERVGMLLQSEITPSELPRAGFAPAIWAVGPIIDGHELLGQVAVELPMHELEDIVGDRWGLGRTGEVLVAAPMRDGTASRLILTGPLRSDPRAGFHQAIAGGTEVAGRLELAISGAEGRGPSSGIDGEEVLAAWSYSPSFQWAVSTEIDRAEVFAWMGRLRDVSAASVLAILCAVVAAAIRVSARISAPLRDAASAAGRIARGDLSQKVAVRGQGETRELLDGIQRTVGDLAALVGRIQQSAGAILASSSSVRRVAGEQDGVARELGTSSSQIAAATNQMHATARELAATVRELGMVADRASEAAGEGRTALQRLGDSMGRLTAGAGQVNERLQEISSRASAIDAVTGAITKVANQTNLLAVNAAIEAEKAGEHGLGFQVVAREIDRLATQAASSALEIESILASLQGAVGHGVRQLEQFGTTVTDGCGTAHAASEQLGTLLRQVEELQASFRQVAVAVEAQNDGVAQVNEAMTRLVDGARRTASSASESSRASAELESSAKSLEAEVSKFRLR